MARPSVALAAYVPGSANKTGAAPIVGRRGSLIQLINIRANSNKTKAQTKAQTSAPNGQGYNGIPIEQCYNWIPIGEGLTPICENVRPILIREIN